MAEQSTLRSDHSPLLLQRSQNKYLRIIINARWRVINDTLRHNLNVPYVRDEIKRFSQRYADMEEHPNILATNLMKEVDSKENYLLCI